MTPNPQPDTTDPVLEQLEMRLFLMRDNYSYGLASQEMIGDVERAIAIHKAQMKVIHAATSLTLSSSGNTTELMEALNEYYDLLPDDEEDK